MSKRIVWVVIAMSAAWLCGLCYSQENKIDAPPEKLAYATNVKSVEVVKALMSPSPDERARAIVEVLANSDIYAPPVFYLTSSVLYDLGRRDEAIFWFYAGQLRARFDANRCLDSSARQAVGVLNQKYGTPINQYAVKDLGNLELVVRNVVAWDKNTPHNYDGRWIANHGMDAVIRGLAGGAESKTAVNIMAPADRWGHIAEQNRADYIEGFRTFLLLQKSRQ
jgi:hypothetical protein